MARFPSTVTSPRLELRRWTPADAPAIHALVQRNLEHLRPWMGWIATEPVAEPNRTAMLREWDAAWRRGSDCMYGVFLDGVPVGGAGLHRRIGPGGVEIGYWIAAGHLRRGFATEVAAALTTAAFETPGVERVEIHHDEANVASRQIPERLGFTPTLTTPRPVEAPAEVGIEWRWTMTRKAWRAISPPPPDPAAPS